MYRSFDIAKKLLEYAKRDNISMDPMKLLKLVYIAHGFYLGYKGKALISDPIEAWKYGPVIPTLYHVIKRFGYRQVDADLLDLYAENELSKEDADFLASVWDAYKNFDGLQLSSKTHQSGTPWDIIYGKNQYNSLIPNDVISTYYADILAKTP